MTPLVCTLFQLRQVSKKNPGLIQLVLTGLAFSPWVLLVAGLQLRQGSSDCAPELAFASGLLGHLLGSTLPIPLTLTLPALPVNFCGFFFAWEFCI